MEAWMNIGKALEDLLRLQTYPLAIKLVKDESEFPERTRRPDKKIAVCQALTLSRRNGWTMGITGNDSGCATASLAYGWPEPADESRLSNFYLKGGYASDQTGTKRIVDNIPRLEPGKYGGLIVSPLARTKIIPDVIVVYGNPGQIMRLVHGAVYKDGKRIKSEFAGIVGSCADGIVQTFKTDEYQMVLPGNGDRIFALTYDNEMIFTIPASKANDIVEGMKAQRLAKYPIPLALQMPPPIPDF